LRVCKSVLKVSECIGPHGLELVEFLLEVDVLFVVQSQQRHLTIDSLQLLVEVLPKTDAQICEALRRIALAILSELLELCEDVLDRGAKLISGLCLKHLLDGDLLK